jgi:hypothetical protein
MAQVTPVIADFRTLFPQFADDTTYPDSLITAYFAIAECYIQNEANPCLSDNCLLQAIYLMTAHLLRIQDLANAGKTPAFVTSATVGSVTVATQPPPQTDQWQWWLSLTPYGQSLLAMLQVAGAAGIYAGSLPERAAFRKVGGIF